MKDTSRITW